MLCLLIAIFLLLLKYLLALILLLLVLSGCHNCHSHGEGKVTLTEILVPWRNSRSKNRTEKYLYFNGTFFSTWFEPEIFSLSEWMHRNLSQRRNILTLLVLPNNLTSIAHTNKIKGTNIPLNGWFVWKGFAMNDMQNKSSQL